ncbi:MAG: hypothetical protein WBL25_14670 [Anaerolineales bacterium]
MDKTTKTVLIVIGSILVLCACTGIAVFATGLWTFSRVAHVAEQSVSVSPEAAVRVGGEIADYEVPEGFGSPVSVHIGDMTLLRYTTQNENSYILLAQFPEGTSVNVEEMLRLMEEGSGDPNSVWYSTETTRIEQKPLTIRGQATTLNISEGTSSEGITYRYATARFEGKGGPALVMVASPLGEWDIELVEEFISSIR